MSHGAHAHMLHIYIQEIVDVVPMLLSQRLMTHGCQLDCPAWAWHAVHSVCTLIDLKVNSKSEIGSVVCNLRRSLHKGAIDDSHGMAGQQIRSKKGASLHSCGMLQGLPMVRGTPPRGVSAAWLNLSH